MEQFNSGVQFHVRNPYSQVQHWSDERWNLAWQPEEVQKGNITIVLIIREQSFTSVFFRDTLDIISFILRYRTKYYFSVEYSITSTTLDVLSIFTIINNGLILGGQDSSRRQTVFFLPIDPRDKDHKDPEHIDFSVPRRAKYVHSAWKKHPDAVFWVDIFLRPKRD